MAATLEAHDTQSGRDARPGGSPRHRSRIPLALLITFGWTAFAMLWLRTLSYTAPQTVRLLSLLLAGSLAATVGVTALWIHHNLRLYARKGPRRAVPQVARSFDRDGMGRMLEVDWEVVRQAGYVLVIPTLDRKLIRAEDAGVLPDEAEGGGQRRDGTARGGRQ